MSKPLYIAGPMTGIPQFNFPAFHEAAARLRSAGYAILSPAELDDPATAAAAMASPDGAPGSGCTNGETWGDFLARDVKMVADESCGVVLLSGWERSRGARLETFVALLCGHPICFYHDGTILPADVDVVRSRLLP
jgi:hypothetical protein